MVILKVSIRMLEYIEQMIFNPIVSYLSLFTHRP
jgi:hypothetical protein